MADISIGAGLGVAASIATIIGLAVTLVDRRRKRSEPETPREVPATAAPAAKTLGGDPETSEDVRYVLLLEACMWLASDLNLVWTTLGEKRRSIELIERFTPELEHDLAKFSSQLDNASPGTSDFIRRFLSKVFKPYVEVMLSNTSWLEHRSDGDQEAEETEYERKSLRYAFVTGQERIETRLRTDRTYLSALAEQKKNGSWKILGFDSPEDYAEYLQPTMRSLVTSPGELAEDVLSRLLDGPISLDEMKRENLPDSIRVELMNRLLADKWAELTPGKSVVLTDAGRRLLRKRLATWHG